MSLIENKTVAWVVFVIAAAAGVFFLFSHRAAAPGAAAPSSAPQAAATLAGNWRSTQDSAYSVAFNGDGTLTDYYNNTQVSTSTSGTWQLFTKENPDPNFSGPALDEGAVYLTVEESGTAYHYRIATSTPIELDLVYLDRGGVLTFTRAAAVK